LSLSVGAGHATEVNVDGVVVRTFYLLEGKQQWMILFNEDFEQLKKKNGMENRG